MSLGEIERPPCRRREAIVSDLGHDPNHFLGATVVETNRLSDGILRSPSGGCKSLTHEYTRCTTLNIIVLNVTAGDQASAQCVYVVCADRLTRRLSHAWLDHNAT